MNITIQGKSFGIPDGLSEEQINGLVHEIALQEGLIERQGALGYSVDQAQKMAGKGAEVLGDLTGFEGLKDWGKSVVAQQDKDIAEGGYQPQYIGSLRETFGKGGLGDAMGWIGEKTAENAASAGFALGGGVVAAGTALVSVPLATVVGLGTLAGSAVMGTGETALSMEEKTGEYDSAMAAGAGAIIGILDKFGAGKVIPKSQLANMSTQQIINALQKAGKNDAGQAILQFFTRNAKKAGFEGGTEALQQGTSIGATAASGGEYSGQEVTDELIDAAAIGTSMGGGVGVAGDTVSGVATGVKKGANKLGGMLDLEGYTAMDKEAAANLATRLKKLADDNKFDLNDLDKTSKTGAREVADQAHVDIAEMIKAKISDLKSRVKIDANGIDTLAQVEKKVQANAAVRKARNKTKSIVGVADLEAIEKLAGDTLEGQEMLALMRESNELTKLHNSGYQAGLTKYTDQFSIFGSNVGYDKSAVATEKLLRPIATGGLALQTGGASLAGQVGISTLGKIVDSISGKRSVVQNYINANEGQQGLNPTQDTFPSLRQQRIDAEAESQLRTEQGRQALEQSRINSINSNVNPRFGIYKEFEEMGLKPEEWQKGLDILLAEGRITQAQYDTMQTNPLNLRQEDEGYLVILNELNRLLGEGRLNPTTPTTPSTPTSPSGTQQQQQTQADPFEGLTPQQRRGAIANRNFILKKLDELQADFENGNLNPNSQNDLKDGEVIAQALEQFGTNLGQDPILSSQQIYSGALAKLNNKELASKYLLPYMDRVQRQQSGKSGEEDTTVSYRTLRNPTTPPPKRKLREIGEELEKHQMEKYGRKLDPFNNEEDYKIVVDELTQQAQFELDDDPNVWNWYDDDIKKAIDEQKRTMPEIEDPANHKLLLLLTAITSIGEKPIINWRQGASLALHYFEGIKKGTAQPQISEVVEIDGKERRVNPTTGKILGFKGASKEPALKLIQHMIDTMGVKGMMDWLHSVKTKKDIDAMRAEVGLGKQSKILGGMNAEVPGVYIFGQKVAPFYLNLMGINDVTVDLWASRNIRRLTGKLLNPLYGKDNKASELIDTPTAAELPIFKRMFEDVGKNLGYTPQQAQAILWKYEQALYNDLGGKFKHEKFSEGAIAFNEKDLKAYEQRNGIVDARDAPTTNRTVQQNTKPILSQLPDANVSPQDQNLANLLDKSRKGKLPEIKRDLIKGVDMNGRKTLSRVVVGLDGKGISDEDIVFLLPYIKSSFEYLHSSSEADGDYNFLNGKIRVKKPYQITEQGGFRHVFLHELAHSLSFKTDIQKFVDGLTDRITGRVVGGTPLTPKRIEQFIDILNSSIDNNPEVYGAASLGLNNVLNELHTKIDEYNRKNPDKPIDKDSFVYQLTKPITFEGTKSKTTFYFPPPSHNQRTTIRSINRKLGSNMAEKVQDVFDYSNYVFDPNELAANSFSSFLADPKSFKKNYPKLASAYTQLLNNSQFKDFITINSIIGMIGTAGLMALLSQYGDDEEGVLNFGGGILAA